jgi:hypothetical protein
MMLAISEKIVSSGQTGADRAALDWAISNGVTHGGWCPKGRRPEDGPIGSRYLLDETPGSDYVQRTESRCCTCARTADTIHRSVLWRISSASTKFEC